MRYPRYPAYKDTSGELLGPVPVSWGTWQLKYVARMKYGDSLASEARDDLGTVHVFGSNGVVGCHSEANTLSPVIIVGRKGSFGKVAYSLQAVFSIDTTFFIDSTCCSENLRWLYFALQVAQLDAISQDTGVPGLSRDQAYRTPFIVPSTEEQNAIAAFLDRETAKIDTLIAKQERLIALLQEKRQALISHAVTKGLNPDVPMKDSGLEWLGEIPQHWATTQLKRIAQPGTSITYGIVQAGPDTEGGIPYIRTSDMNGDVLPRSGYLRTTPEIDQKYQRSKVAAGDIVIAIRASVGKALAVPDYLDGANLTQGTAKISPGQEIDSAYLLWVLGATGSQQRFEAISKGATFKEITLDMLNRFSIPLPPKEEQTKIALHLQSSARDIDRLTACVNTCISALQERRAALVSAAVTGKIDVRGYAN